MALQGKTTVIKRGSTADNNLLLGAKGEIVVNESTKSLRVHTGTRGGTELMRADMQNMDITSSTVIDFNGARLRDVGTPVSSTDVATKGYVDSHGGGGGGSSTLEGLSDVALGTLSSGEVLKYDGTNWVNDTISVEEITGGVATETYVDDQISGLGTASTYNVGTSANNVVKLDGSARLPAVDGSLLTGVVVSGGLLATNNLSDLSSTSTARTNLGLGSVAVLNTTAVLQVSNNLSDVGNTGTARSNLGLGSVATYNVGTSSGTVPVVENVAMLSGGKISSDVLPDSVITETDLASLKDVANGIAGLDSNGHILSSVLPDLAITHVSSGLLADRPVATVDNQGDVYIATDTSQTFISTGSDWSEILNLNSASIADLISDMDNLKASIGDIINSESAEWVGFDGSNYMDGEVSLKESILALDTQIKANTDSLGSVLTTSSSIGDLGDVVISGSPSGKFLKRGLTDWVDSVVDHSDVVGLGDAALKTAGTSAGNVLLLDGVTGKFSGSLISDSSITSAKISGSIPVGSISGLGTSATIDVGTTANKILQLDSNAKIPAVNGSLITNISATQVSGISGVYAPLSSPALTDIPTAPTATVGTNTTQIATTAFVLANAGGSVSHLDDIGDVALNSAISGDLLKYDGSQWVNKRPGHIGDYVALTDASITLDSGKYYVYSSVTDTTQKNVLTLPSNSSLTNTGGDTIWVAIVDSIENSSYAYVLKAGTNTRIIYEDTILAEATELSLLATGLYTITHVVRDGAKRYLVTLDKSSLGLGDLSDVEITTGSLVAGQTLRYNGSVFLNTKLASTDMTDTTSIAYKTDNLSGFSDYGVARTNLGLKGLSVLDAGTGLSTSGSNLNVSLSLDGLTDVALGTLSSGQVLKYNGTNWVNDTDSTGGGGGDVTLAGTNVFTGTNTFSSDNTFLIETSLSSDILRTDGSNVKIYKPSVEATTVYVYVKYDFRSSMDDYFYIFTTDDNGVTREAVPLTLIADNGVQKLQAINAPMMGSPFTWDNVYSGYSGGYLNSSNVPNASFSLEGGKTYYISSWNRVVNGNDIQMAISTSSDGVGLTYKDLTDDYVSGDPGESIYEIDGSYGVVSAGGISPNVGDPTDYVPSGGRTVSIANFDSVQEKAIIYNLDVIGTTALGIATATTPSTGNDSTRIATTAYVQNELGLLTIPTSLDTLTDVSYSGLPSLDQVLKYNGTGWVNASISTSELTDGSNIALLDGANEFTANNSLYGGDIAIYDGANVTPQTVYLYVKYNATSRTDNEYFYIFKTTNGGATRESVDLTLLTDGGTDYLEESSTNLGDGVYKKYRASQSSAYTNPSTAPNASLVIDANSTYYFIIRTDNDNTSPNVDFQAYISVSNTATGFTYNNVLPYGGGFYDDGEGNKYTIALDNSSWGYVGLLSPTLIVDADPVVAPV
ncbi:hypothetical protein EB001_07365, partial [bacterium]|nr:hypothetical protein [bacterium]